MFYKKVTLTNNFHNSEVSLRLELMESGKYKGFYKVSPNQTKQAYNKLCGISGCTCGDTFGSRGGIHLELINQDYDNNYYVQINGDE